MAEGAFAFVPQMECLYLCTANYTKKLINMMNLNQKLSEHFTLREFVRSATAKRLGIDNTPQMAHVARLCNLCLRVLEPLRRQYGRIIITSGYRCTELNRAVGGVANSQHQRGEAADIHIPDMMTGMKMFNFIRQHCDYDQLIFERSPRTGSVWIHVSCRNEGNRRMAIEATTLKASRKVSPAPSSKSKEIEMAGGMTSAVILSSIPLRADFGGASATLTCTRCGKTLPETKFEMMRTGTRRRVCNHCRWLYYVKPSRDRSILRALERRNS